tara:strand:- start:1907 stop:2134 length:228 start_codon:yes stop_codon:yes gene_type:complete
LHTVSFLYFSGLSESRYFIAEALKLIWLSLQRSLIRALANKAHCFVLFESQESVQEYFGFRDFRLLGSGIFEQAF